MRHSISVHIFPLFILIIFTLYSIPYIYTIRIVLSYQNFYILCIFNIYRLFFFLSKATIPSGQIPRIFQREGDKDKHIVSTSFHPPVEGGGKGGEEGLQNVWNARWMSPRAFQVARARFEILTLALFHRDPRSFYYAAGGTRFRGLAQFQVHDAP